MKQTKTKCPFCSRDIYYLSKREMVYKILKAVGYPKEKSIYNDGTLTRTELYAIYQFVMKNVKKEKRR